MRAGTSRPVRTIPAMSYTSAAGRAPNVVSQDVVVVGGGISGLVVAHELTKRNFSVVVLEARDRMGGRLLRHRIENTGNISNGVQHLDLGATWFWPGEKRIQALIQELQVSTHSHYVQGDAMYHDKPVSQRLNGNPIDSPVSGRFSNGAAALTDALAAKLPSDSIRLSAPVQCIRTSGDAAVVEYTGGVIKAKHVVLALPPALAVHAITFDPALPSQVARIAVQTSVWMGAIAKAVIVYEKPFWRENGLTGCAISHRGPLRQIHDMSGPDGSPAAIFGFAMIGKGSPAPTVAQVKEQMVEIFGPRAASVSKIIVQDWSTEEFTSPPGVLALGSSSQFGHGVFQKPTGQGRLHWVSTETATVAPGHIEGAIQAAQRAVTAIAAAK